MAPDKPLRARGSDGTGHAKAVAEVIPPTFLGFGWAEQPSSISLQAQASPDANLLSGGAHLDVGGAGDPVRCGHGAGGYPLAGVGEVGG